MPRRAACEPRFLFAAALLLLAAAPGAARMVPCRRASDAALIRAALERLASRADPCGESAEVATMLERFAHCPNATYEICTRMDAARNLFDRPFGPSAERQPRTITWNPGLSSELQRGCGTDRTRPVPRDPTASLLHEIVHAVHDCEGLNPGEHELEAVRIENIYRRAAGLCQRTGYGDEPLPPRMRRSCTPESCDCTTPVPAEDAPRAAPGKSQRTAAERPVADAAPSVRAER